MYYKGRNILLNELGELERNVLAGWRASKQVDTQPFIAATWTYSNRNEQVQSSILVILRKIYLACSSLVSPAGFVFGCTS